MARPRSKASRKLVDVFREDPPSVLTAAAAIANARGGRRGMPPIENVLELLPPHLRDEVCEDAREALFAGAALWVTEARDE